MAEDTTAVQTDDLPDIEDVSLVDTPIAPKSDAATTEQTADKGTETAAADSDKAAKTDDKAATGDAKTTEATDQKDKTEGQKPDEQQDQKQEQPAQTKEQREAAAQKAWQERQRTKQAVAQKVTETYAPKSKDEFVKDGLTPEQAEVQALREEMAFNNRRAEIAELNAGLQTQAVNVANDFPVFNPKSQEYDEAFTKEVQDAYATAARLQTDENGIVLNAEVPLYDFYQKMANIYSRGTARGNQQGQDDMAEMLSKTEPTGGSAALNQGEESFDELEARLGDVAIT